VVAIIPSEESMLETPTTENTTRMSEGETIVINQRKKKWFSNMEKT